MRGSWFAHLVVAGLRFGALGAGGQVLGQPAVDAAVQVAVALVADGVQGPQQAPGPAAALVVVGHHPGIRGQAQFGEQRGQCLVVGQQARCRLGARQQTLVVQVDGAGHMGLVVHLILAQIDDQQVRRGQMVGQIGGFDEKRQFSGHD